jgi:hypothetical protein
VRFLISSPTGHESGGTSRGTAHMLPR